MLMWPWCHLQGHLSIIFPYWILTTHLLRRTEYRSPIDPASRLHILCQQTIYIYGIKDLRDQGGGGRGMGRGGGISQSQSQSQNFIQYRSLTKNHDWRHTWQVQTCNYHYKTKFILKIAKHPIFPFLTGCIDTFILFRCCASAVKRKPNVLWTKSILHACMTKFGFDDNGSLHFDTLNIYGVRKC